MPIFEYNCASCDHHFEIIVLSPREKISCPNVSLQRAGIDQRHSAKSPCLYGNAANLRLRVKNIAQLLATTYFYIRARGEL